ncbi:MAG: hypothetical protein E5X86_19615 [Mesorhizobium sp.]|uniref:hypothetical protein n=1 Tax=Mesorhizobium sp. TaxID=1871066 RepID=UPI0011F9BC66|nr:hypothetical protein [Mesorhizobium sp.]TIO15581.1 MAG: hypothetical protein E5X86_19615 [Mesorhizobium sp.]
MSARLSQVPGTPRDETPADGYGAGFLEYNIRSSFRDLCRLLGRSQAREVIAEIINAEFERKHNG